MLTFSCSVLRDSGIHLSSMRRTFRSLNSDRMALSLERTPLRRFSCPGMMKVRKMYRFFTKAWQYGRSSRWATDSAEMVLVSGIGTTRMNRKLKI